MAWLEVKSSGMYQVSFRFGGQRYKKSLKTKSENKAETLKARIEETIELIERGRLDLPADVDIPTFLLSDGKLNSKPKIAKAPTLTTIFSQYLESLPVGAMEDNSLYTIQIHMKHLQSVLGSQFLFKNIETEVLQKYINHRSQQKGRRGRIVSTTTIKKEIGTLSSVWTWAKNRKVVTTDFPSSNLKFPKLYDKPPFQTWKQIEQQISRGNLRQATVEELWDCLYLTRAEIDKVLDFVKKHARHDFIYPMVVTAAHTGARRSELIRSQPEDVDLSNGLFRIREKKKAKERVTIRTVPLSPVLATVLKQWLDSHSASSFTFYNSCKRCKSSENHSAVTGLKVGEATHHFQQTFKGSSWSNIRGWHVFRHSFASNCAVKGVDQRIINEWMGHQTEEMVRRYRHLFPDTQAAAIASVFGKKEESLAVHAM